MCAARGRLAALLLGAAVAGCGSPPPSSTPAATPRPLAGTPIDAGAFVTEVPDGWENDLGNPAAVQALATVGGAVVFLVEQAPPGQAQSGINDVRANINVVTLAQPVPDDQLSTYLGSVSSSGATNVSLPLPFIVDGASGLAITYDRDIRGTPGESRDMVVNHRGVTYHVVLNTSQYAFNGQVAALEGVLSAWRWSQR